MIMSKEKLIKSIREIPDFPIPGILFYDVTTLFKDSERLQELSDIMYEMYKDKGITKVVGCLLYTSPSPRDRTRSRMPSSA